MIENPFYALVPPGIYTGLLVVLSSAATVIASQALISGAFSLTRQAMLLGYLPRVTIKHTAYHTEGQIYIPEVNNLLAIGCILLVLTFRESENLAAAYGIAVTGTMAITSILYYIVVRHSWGWSRWRAGALLVLFLAVDIPFLVANLFKFLEGGYVPMLIGATLIAGMLIWSRGRIALMERYSSRYPTLEAAQPFIDRWLCSRVPGTAVFLAPSADHVPPILVHHVERTRSLHETVVLLTVLKTSTPVVLAAVAISVDLAERWVLQARRLVRLHGRTAPAAGAAADFPGRATSDSTLTTRPTTSGTRRLWPAMTESSAGFPRPSFPTSTATPFMKRDTTACRRTRSSKSARRLTCEKRLLAVMTARKLLCGFTSAKGDKASPSKSAPVGLSSNKRGWPLRLLELLALYTRVPPAIPGICG